MRAIQLNRLNEFAACDYLWECCRVAAGELLAYSN